MLVGTRLRELRCDAEVSQAELSTRTGIWRPIIGRIERGVHTPSLNVIARIAGALGLDIETVLVVLDDEWRAGAKRARVWAALARTDGRRCA